MSSRTKQDRHQQLAQWVNTSLAQQPRALSLQPLPGDAGRRQYFRLPTVEGYPPLLAVDAPPDTEKNTAFIEMAQALAQQNVNVPNIIANDLTQGFLLISDLGNDMYLSALNLASADTLHHQAIDALLRIQTCPRDALPALPVYSSKLLLEEVQRFPEWLLYRYLDIELDTETTAQLNSLFHLLIEQALAQPQVCVHFDYHPRNLLVSDTGNPGVIDFQDACIGPITYDLASLFRDNFTWPREKIEKWVEYYQKKANAAGLLTPVSREEFLRWFDWMSLQRMIKLLGHFIYLAINNDAPKYFDYFNVTLVNAIDVTRRYPEFSFLNALLVQQVVPALKKTNHPLEHISQALES